MHWLAAGAAPATGLPHDTAALVPLPLRATRVFSGGRHTVVEVDAGDSADGEPRSALAETAAALGTAAARARRPLVAYGADECGQLAGALTLALSLPLRVREVACGWAHTLLLVDRGAAAAQLFACGCGADGRLGLGFAAGLSDRHAFEPVSLPAPAVFVACGGRHSLTALADGRVFAWGCDRDGELGQREEIAARFSPVPLCVDAIGDDAVVGVVAGWSHSAAITRGGRVFTWGSNRLGQCGRPYDGSAACRRPRLGPAVVGLAHPDGGNCSALALRLSSGWSHMLCACGDSKDMGADSVLFAWGRADLGQLGDGLDTAAAEVGAPAIADQALMTTSTSTPTVAPRFRWRPLPVVLSCGDKASHGCSAVARPLAIACGAESSFAARGCGCLYAWGWNAHGNLGLGHSRDQALPALVRVGDAGRVRDVVGAGALLFVKVDK